MKKIIFIMFLLTISCTNNKVVNNHGLNALELKKDQIIISKTNKNDLINIVGKPSTISLFDKNLWYYIQREKVNQSVLKLGKKKIQKNNVLEIKFDKYGIVESKKLYQIDDMNDLKVEKKATQKKYQTNSAAIKALNSFIQKINSPSKKRK
tara:strand:- start:108 stop:560 length:453 start_codon:yes stop_codon:yes gene_type:complete